MELPGQLQGTPTVPYPTVKISILEGQGPISWVILLALARRAASIGHSIQTTAPSFGAHFAGPGSSLGGIGVGYGDRRSTYLCRYRESFQFPYTLVPSGQKITWGAWSALDVATGKILWQTADPTVGTIDTGS